VLHDLGKLVLVSGVPRAWREAIAAADAGSIPLWQAERSRLAATHAEVGAALLALWGLSDPIVEAVAFHHEPEVSGSNSFCALTAVHAANLLVKGEALDGLPYLESLGLAGRIEHWRGLAGESAR
jgi:HD-like signal output (HDOD) protein